MSSRETRRAERDARSWVVPLLQITMRWEKETPLGGGVSPKGRGLILVHPVAVALDVLSLTMAWIVAGDCALPHRTGSGLVRAVTAGTTTGQSNTTEQRSDAVADRPPGLAAPLTTDPVSKNQ